MFGAIKYGLTHLLDFSGRDARQTFWYYMLFIIVAQFLIGFVAVIPSMIGLIGDTVNAASNATDDAAMESAIQVAIGDGMGDMLRQQMWFSLILSLVCCALFAASFVRRLQDAGYTGWIALVPIATVLLTAWLTFTSIETITTLLEEAFANPEALANPETALEFQNQIPNYGWIGWIGYLVVIVFGIFKSTDGPNQYGEAPVRY